MPNFGLCSVGAKTHIKPNLKWTSLDLSYPTVGIVN